MKSYKWTKNHGHQFGPGDICFDPSLRRSAWKFYGIAQVESVEYSKDERPRFLNLIYTHYYSRKPRRCRRHCSKIMLLLSYEQARRGAYIHDYLDHPGGEESLGDSDKVADDGPAVAEDDNEVEENLEELEDMTQVLDKLTYLVSKEYQR